MTAHQKIIRNQLAATEPAPVVNRSLADAVVRQIDYQTAAALIVKYEWLGTMPVAVKACYGIFFDGEIGGAVVFAVEPTENLGVWDAYGYTGRVILLARGACAHWTPNNTASRLIAAAIRLLPERYAVVTATVDAAAGEVGTIYQACNFVYVGNMSRHRISRPRRPPKRLPAARKPRYFYFRDAALRAAIAHLIKPYPKRGEPPAATPKRSPWHRTGKQKRRAITERLLADPTKSDRLIALEVGCHGMTVAAVRRELVARAEIRHVATRVDSLGRRVIFSKGGTRDGQEARHDGSD